MLSVLFSNVKLPPNHYELVYFLVCLMSIFGLVSGPYLLTGFYPLNLFPSDFIKSAQLGSRSLLIV